MKHTTREKAAGQTWNKIRLGNPGIRMVGIPIPSWINTGTAEKQQYGDVLDNHKSLYNKGKQDAEAGIDRQSDESAYLSGYSYGEYLNNV